MSRSTATTANPKLRSRAYPVIALPESLGLLQRLKDEIGWGERDRDSIARALGYAGGHSGIAARKAAALAHFGLLALRDGRYAPTALAREILEVEDEESRRRLLREAFLSPALFRDIVHRYEPTGRVPRQLAVALHDHGIQVHAQDEVARIFMQSAVYAGVLASDGSFRGVAGQEASRATPSEAPAGTESPSLSSREGAAPLRQVLRFQVTEQKEVIFDLPASLDQADILLLEHQIQFLKAQVEQNRPDRPVLLDHYRDRRKR